MPSSSSYTARQQQASEKQPSQPPYNVSAKGKRENKLERNDSSRLFSLTGRETSGRKTNPLRFQLKIQTCVHSKLLRRVANFREARASSGEARTLFSLKETGSLKMLLLGFAPHVSCFCSYHDIRNSPEMFAIDRKLFCRKNVQKYNGFKF